MDIKKLRNRIDRIDNDMLRLFTERMAVAEEIGKYKAAHDLPIEDIDREQEIIDTRVENSGDKAPYIRRFFRHLFALSKERQREITATAKTTSSPKDPTEL